MDKGVSPFVSMVMVVAFGIVMIGIVFSTLNLLEREGATVAIQDQISFTQQEMATEILGVYNSVKDSGQEPTEGDAALVSEISMSLPNQIGGQEYRIYSEEPQDILISITEFTIDGEQVTSETRRPTARLVGKGGQGVHMEYKVFNIDIGLKGIANGGDTRIRGYKYNYDGDIRDIISVGDSEILVGVKSISTEDGCDQNERNIIVDGFLDYYDNSRTFSSADLRFNVEDEDGNEVEGSYSEGVESDEYTKSFCAEIEEREEYVLLTDISDDDGDRGYLRKRFIG